MDNESIAVQLRVANALALAGRMRVDPTQPVDLARVLRQLETVERQVKEAPHAD